MMKRVRQVAVVGLVMLWLASALCLRAQQEVARQPAVGSLAAVLDQLAEAARALQTTLPSFECTETVVSRRMRDEKETWRVEFTATLRSGHEGGKGSRETFDVTSVKGKSKVPKKFDMPVYVRGGFDSALDVFLREGQACYVFTLAPGRIDYTFQPKAEDILRCGAMYGLKGFALLDAKGDVTHVERTIPIDVAVDGRLAPSAAIDLAPVELNGKMYRLSSHLTATWPRDDDTDFFDATYTGCHLFTATIKLLPGAAVVPEGAAGPPPK